MSSNIFETGLDRTRANFQPLSPIGFLERSASIFPNRVAIISGDQTWTYAQFHARSCRLASALQRMGVGVGDTVSIMSANTPQFLEAHFGVPASGAVLNPLNTRLDAAGIAFILDHGECDVLFVDSAYSAVISDALTLCSRAPKVIDITDALVNGGQLIGFIEYEDFLATGDQDAPLCGPADEWQAIALNYTSGTTANPKGVVYSHRGAYLNTLGNAVSWPLGECPVYLWTLPMFHCDGWCFPWTITMAGGTHVCLRETDAASIIDAIIRHDVTHFCCAPVILNNIRSAPAELTAKLPSGVRCMTAGAPPPPAVIDAMSRLGFDVTHTYGLTEVYGPCVVNVWQPEWDGLTADEKANRHARQGVRYATQECLEVVEHDSEDPIVADGETIGEIVFRGNTVMKGYLKNPAATAEAFAGGWFHSGDLAVRHEDGYVEIRDRLKDIIISGGENISSIEVENVLCNHPAVSEAAVVGVPDEKWGETPFAFIVFKNGQSATEAELRIFCRSNLAHFKCPSRFIFQALPKTSTGKVQKFSLREVAATIVSKT